MTLQRNSTRIQAPAKRLPVSEASGKRDDDRVSIKRKCGTLDVAEVKAGIFRPKVTLSIGTWNVRIIKNDYAVKLLVEELERFRCDIVGIAETHRLGVEELQEGEYKIKTSGRE